MKDCCDPPAALLQPNYNSPAVEWCANNAIYRYKDHRITVIPSSSPIKDGVYTNATLRFEGGCIVEVTTGANVVYSACDPCGDNPIPTPTNGVILSGNSCNLSTFENTNELVTLLYTTPSACIMLTGCGTPASPLQANPQISSLAGNQLSCQADGLFVPPPNGTIGVNFAGCGIEIENGLVTFLPLPFQPVLNLYNTDGSVLIQRDADNPCNVRLTALLSDQIANLVGSGLGGALTANAPGDLTNPPQNVNFMAVVGVANPRDVYMYVVASAQWVQLLGVTVNL